MNFSYDYLNRFITPKITLCNPDSVYDNGNITRSIGVIQNVKNFSIDYNFNSYSQGSFECDFSGDVTEGAFLFITKRRYIFVEHLGFCIITDCSEDKTKDTWVKKITFCTCDKELENYESPMLVIDETSMTLPLYSLNKNTNDMVKTLNNILWNWTVECDDNLKGFINNNNLPSEYQELPYVQLNGYTYIDTGYVPNINTTITIEAKLNDNIEAEGCLFGSQGYETTVFHQGLEKKASNKFVLWHNTAKSADTETIIFNNGENWNIKKNINNSSFDKKKFTMTYESHLSIEKLFRLTMNNKRIGSTMYSSNRLFSQDTEHENKYRLYIGTLNQNGNADSRMYKGRIYYCSISEGTLQREYIPCFRKSDDKVGLYDKVENVFEKGLCSDFNYEIGLYATFTEQSSNNMFDFLYNDIQKQYNVIVDCDYVNRIITLRSKDNYQHNHKSDIRISSDLYNSLSLEDNIDNEFTGYNVAGDSDISISSVNPMGNSIIYDFTKYQNENWMTSDLNSAINKWKNNVEKSKPLYQDLNKLKDKAFVDISAKIQDYEKELQDAETNRQLFVNAYDAITTGNNEYTNEALNQFSERYQTTLFGGLNSSGHLPITLVPDKIWNKMFTNLFRDDDFSQDISEDLEDHISSYTHINAYINGYDSNSKPKYKQILDSYSYTRTSVINGKNVQLKLLDYYCLDESQNIVKQIIADDTLYDGKTVVSLLQGCWDGTGQSPTVDDIKNHLELILRGAKEYYIGYKGDKDNIFFVLQSEITNVNKKRLLIPTNLRPSKTGYTDKSFKDTAATEYIPIYPKGIDTIYNGVTEVSVTYCSNCNYYSGANIFGTSSYHIYYLDKDVLKPLIHSATEGNGINYGKRLIQGYYWLFNTELHESGLSGTQTKFFFDVYWEDLWNYYCIPYTGFKIKTSGDVPYGNHPLNNEYLYGKFFSVQTIDFPSGHTATYEQSLVESNMYHVHYGLFHYGTAVNSYDLYTCDWYKANEDNKDLGEPKLDTGEIGGHDMALHCWKNIIFYRFKDNAKLYLYAKYYYDKVPIQQYKNINTHHCESYTRRLNGVSKQIIRSFDTTYDETAYGNASSDNYDIDILKATFWWDSVYWAREAKKYLSIVKNADWENHTDELLNYDVAFTYKEICNLISQIIIHCSLNITAKQIIKIIIHDDSSTDWDIGDTIWTDELLRQLICYINIGEYVNEDITVNDSMTINEQYEQLITLMDKATESLSIASQGVLQFSIDNKSFIFDVAFAPYTAQLKLGCSVYIETSPNEYETVFLSSISINYSDKTISLTFGDKQAKFDIRSLFDEVLGDVSKSSLQIKKLAGRVKKLESKN